MGVEIGRRSFLARLAAFAAGGELLGAPRGSLARPARRVSTMPRTLQQAMRGHVFERGSPGYAGAAHVYNERFDGVLPAAVARPLDAADVRGAVRWLLAHDTPLRARSGGHSYAGYSTLSGGVVLDLRHLGHVSVDHRQRTATVGAGAQLIDVYAGLARRGATIPAGSCPSVGIAGVTLGGGMGLAARALGLTTDNLLARPDRHRRRQTARGRQPHRSGPAVGACAEAAAATSAWSPSSPSGRIRCPASAAYFFVSWPWSSAAEALAAWQAWAPHTRPELTSILHLNAGGGSPSISVSGQYLGPASGLSRLLAPVAQRPGRGVVTGDQDYLATAAALGGCAHTGLAACHTSGHGRRGNA